MDLKTTGYALIYDLNREAKNYDPRSDDHDILGYEAISIRAHLDELEERKEIEEKWKKSTLLSDWGKSTRNKLPELTKRIEDFYTMYSESKNKPAEQIGGHNSGGSAPSA